MQDDIEHTSLEHFDTIMNTNVRGPFFMTMLAVPHLIRSKGIPYFSFFMTPSMWRFEDFNLFQSVLGF